MVKRKSDTAAPATAVNAGGVPQTVEHLERARKLYEEAVAAEKVEKR